MFNNSGSKLKTFAKVVTVILMITSVISGLVMMFTGMDGGFLIGLLSIALGCLCAWLSGLSVYATGQAAESAENCESQLQQVLRKLETLSK